MSARHLAAATGLGLVLILTAVGPAAAAPPPCHGEISNYPTGTCVDSGASAAGTTVGGILTPIAEAPGTAVGAGTEPVTGAVPAADPAALLPPL
ncbi:hypothetical protein [Streptomyces pseudoechinosporeus]